MSRCRLKSNQICQTDPYICQECLYLEAKVSNLEHQVKNCQNCQNYLIIIQKLNLEIEVLKNCVSCHLKSKQIKSLIHDINSKKEDILQASKKLYEANEENLKLATTVSERDGTIRELESEIAKLKYEIEVRAALEALQLVRQSVKRHSH
jgi:uncharacterized coiled-coil DUF342 family protein